MSSVGLLVPVTYHTQTNVNVEINEMRDKLPLEVLQRIASRLSYSDQGRFSQVARFALRALRDMYQDPMALLKAEIEALPAAPLTPENSQRLLVELVSSRAVGHPHYWIPVMNALMGRLTPDLKPDECDNDNFIQSHANIANLLATSRKPISSDQIYQFCRYLVLRQTSKLWNGIKVLAQYERPELDCVSVKKAMVEYMVREAKGDPRFAYEIITARLPLCRNS